MKHTPGPWNADPFGRDTLIVKDFGNGCARHIATVRHPDDVPVILAAPELLESLGDVLSLALLKWGNLDPDANKVFDAARAAIAQATAKGK